MTSREFKETSQFKSKYQARYIPSLRITPLLNCSTAVYSM